MSRYTVIWRRRALGELAGIWLESENRAQVTAAVAAIDSELAYEPLTKGKELSEGLRKL